MRDVLVQRGGLVVLATLALYGWLAPSHVVDGDNAEFCTLAVTGGAAHPSGYPLYVLWLRAMSWLPGTPAHAAALATAILSAASIGVLHAVCRAWGARPLAATFASLLFATGPIVLREYTQAEVFALNGLVVALVLWLAAEKGPLRGVWRGAALGLVAGLGLANHMTCVLVAPVGILGLVRAIREDRRAWIAIATFLLGLTPYLYLFVAPDSPMSWGRVRSVDELIAMILRRDYGGPGAFKHGEALVSMWTSLGAFAWEVARSWLWLPLVCVAFVRRGESRAAWLALAASFLLAGPLLVTRFNVPPTGLGLFVVRRFYMLPMMMLAVPIAVGFDALVERLRRLAPVVVGAAIVGSLVLSLPHLAVVHGRAVENSARNLLTSLPPSSVVIHSQDEFHGALNYLQAARGERTDVAVVTWTLMTFDWYRARVAAKGVVAATNMPGTPLQQLVGTLLATGRPVFVDRLQSELIAAFPSYPHGILIRILPLGAQAPGVADVIALNKQLYAAFALDDPRPGPNDDYATEVHRRYAGIWDILSRAAERAGNRELAAEARTIAQKLGPE
jgi:hypothetical protein